MKDIYNVRKVSRYNFTTERNEVLQGTKIFYDGGIVNTPDKKGQEVLEMSSDRYDAFDHFPQVPGKYEVEFMIIPGSKGQVKMQYVSAKLIEGK